jgi:hypothetical protein
MTLPTCPTPLPSNVTDLLRALAAEWAASPARPEPAPDVLAHWDQLIAAWVADDTLPLFARKFRGNRGAFLTHVSGRVVIPADNTPAHWTYAQALRGVCPTLDDVRRSMADNGIPVAMIMTPAERRLATLTGARTKAENMNAVGWKLAHIKPIVLKGATALPNVPIARLREHFRLFMSPSNMFVIPLALAGLAETVEAVEAIVAWRAARRSG